VLGDSCHGLDEGFEMKVFLIVGLKLSFSALLNDFLGSWMRLFILGLRREIRFEILVELLKRYCGAFCWWIGFDEGAFVVKHLQTVSPRKVYVA
jgi:hypothetical protein